MAIKNPNSKFKIFSQLLVLKPAIHNPRSNQGQILTELLIAIAVVALIVAIGSQFVNLGMYSAVSSSDRQTVNRLANEVFEALRAVAFSNTVSTQGWNNIYLPPDGTGTASSSKGSANQYKAIINAGAWKIASGVETITLENKTFVRYFTIDNVSRTSGAIDAVYNSANDDPQTQKITVWIGKAGGTGSSATSTFYQYFTRYLDESANQADWNSNQCGPINATATTAGYCSSSTIDISNSACSPGVSTCLKLSQ